jgi:RimJ/RimL family protein N-acetyltransferase
MRLLGPRTIIRPYRPADAPAVWEAIAESRASLACWTPDIGRSATLAEVQAGLEQLGRARARRERLVYGIWDRRDQRFLGEIGLHDIDWDRRTAAVGYWLRLSARGQGLVTEALAILEAYATQTLGLQRFEAHVAPENLASRRVVERHGYLWVGERPADAEWDGDAGTVLIYALTPWRNPAG